MASKRDALLAQVESEGIANRRALSRAISLLEDGDPEFRHALERRFAATGASTVLGITGSPGAGKSTLVDALARSYADGKARVAILAVDPSSPFSGGALLGDRIRMSQASQHPNIYIRSMASRGALGGLAPTTREVISLLNLAKFNYILLETVGVGQAEVEIVRTADAVALLLVPGMGDGVQALKAGIIEIADVFVINKSDYPGADQLQKELRRVLSLAPDEGHTPAILRTVASRTEGIEELRDEIERYLAWARESGSLENRRASFLQHALGDELQRQVRERLQDSAKLRARYQALEQRVMARELSPQEAAREIFGELREEKS